MGSPNASVSPVTGCALLSRVVPAVVGLLTVGVSGEPPAHLVEHLFQLRVRRLLLAPGVGLGEQPQGGETGGPFIAAGRSQDRLGCSGRRSRPCSRSPWMNWWLPGVVFGPWLP